MLNRLRKNRIILTVCPPNKVQSRLAVTPTEMMQCTENGIPIKSDLSNELFNDGDTSNRLTLLPEQCRGVDAVSLWNISKDAKLKLNKSKISV